MGERTWAQVGVGRNSKRKIASRSRAVLGIAQRCTRKWVYARLAALAPGWLEGMRSRMELWRLRGFPRHVSGRAPAADLPKVHEGANKTCRQYDITHARHDSDRRRNSTIATTLQPPELAGDRTDPPDDDMATEDRARPSHRGSLRASYSPPCRCGTGGTPDRTVSSGPPAPQPSGVLLPSLRFGSCGSHPSSHHYRLGVCGPAARPQTACANSRGRCRVGWSRAPHILLGFDCPDVRIALYLDCRSSGQRPTQDGSRTPHPKLINNSGGCPPHVARVVAPSQPLVGPGGERFAPTGSCDAHEHLGWARPLHLGGPVCCVLGMHSV